jgi:hypothetical protein
MSSRSSVNLYGALRAVIFLQEIKEPFKSLEHDVGTWDLRERKHEKRRRKEEGTYE